MNLVDTLSAFFARPAEETIGVTPDELCPNCWGRYEYDGEIRKVAKDRQVNINNKAERYAFIQDFAVNHVSGIRLKNEPSGDQFCPTCHTKYRRLH